MEIYVEDSPAVSPPRAEEFPVLVDVIAAIEPEDHPKEAAAPMQEAAVHTAPDDDVDPAAASGVAPSHGKPMKHVRVMIR
jgi:hypothetical protein